MPSVYYEKHCHYTGLTSNNDPCGMQVLHLEKKYFFKICISNPLKLLSLQCIRPLRFITYHKLHPKFLLYMISTLAFGQFRLPKQFGLNVYTQLPFQVSPV